MDSMLTKDQEKILREIRDAEMEDEIREAVMERRAKEILKRGE